MLLAVPYTRLGFGVTVWAFLSLIFLGALGWVLYQNYLFAFDAKPAEAKVMRMFYRTSHGRHGTSYTPYLDYQYTAGPYVFEAVSSVSGTTYASEHIGQRMPVLYVKSHLNDNRIEMPQEILNVKMATVGLIALNLFVVLGGAFLIRYHIRQNRLCRWLQASGLQTRGVVSSVNYDLVGKGQTRKYYLNFDFRDSLGRTVSGRTWYLPTNMESGWNEGSQILVYFDPADSNRFTVNLGQ